jgi:hypothetical protein
MIGLFLNSFERIRLPKAIVLFVYSYIFVSNTIKNVTKKKKIVTLGKFLGILFIDDMNKAKKKNFSAKFQAKKSGKVQKCSDLYGSLKKISKIHHQILASIKLHH